MTMVRRFKHWVCRWAGHDLEPIGVRVSMDGLRHVIYQCARCGEVQRPHMFDNQQGGRR